jgi:TolB protein
MQQPLSAQFFYRHTVLIITILAVCVSVSCINSRREVMTSGATEDAETEPIRSRDEQRQHASSAPLHVRFGLLYTQQANYAAAVAQFDSALMFQPDMLEAKLGRADAVFLSGRLEEGIAGYLDMLSSPESEPHVRAIAERIGAPHAIRQITTAPGENMKARFSPDGRQIVYQSNRDGNWEIYLTEADGSQPARLTENPTADESPCFSPDGDWIAFERGQEQSAAESRPPREIYLMNMLNRDRTASDSSDNLLCISRHPADDWHPVFSPTGEGLAFVSDRIASPFGNRYPRQSDIFLFRFSDSTLTRFTPGLGDKAAPSFAPDGESLLYVNNVNGEFEIFEQKSNGTEPVPRLANGRAKGAPQYSPEGKYIVYFEKRNQNFDLFLFERDKSSTQRLTCDAAIDAFPVFSPDGSEIYFTSNRSGEYQIYALNRHALITRAELANTLQQLREQQRLSRHNQLQ